MAQNESFTYPSADTIQTLHAQRWVPQGRPRAVVQIVHGVSEHMGRYEHVARFLQEQGFAVCGEDHLGHGLTAKGSKYGYFAPKGGWELLVRDIRRLRELEGERYPGVPYVMLGHSMGSFLTRTYLIRYPGTLDGVALSGTGQEKRALVAGGKTLASLLSTLRGPEYVSELVYNLSLGGYGRPFRKETDTTSWLSRDRDMVEANLRDPLCAFRPTVSMFRDMLGGIQLIGNPANLARMDPDIPVYFFSGDRDPVGSMGKGVRTVEKLFREAGCRDVTVKLYPGGRHEMLNETNRQEVMEDLLAWLEAKVCPER